MNALVLNWESMHFIGYNGIFEFATWNTVQHIQWGIYGHFSPSLYKATALYMVEPTDSSCIPATVTSTFIGSIAFSVCKRMKIIKFFLVVDYQIKCKTSYDSNNPL